MLQDYVMISWGINLNFKNKTTNNEQDIITCFLSGLCLQQPAVLHELYTHMNPAFGDPPHDIREIRQTHQYLTACQNLFEKGFLSHKKIDEENSDVLHNIMYGYRFFETWHDALEGNFNTTIY